MLPVPRRPPRQPVGERTRAARAAKTALEEARETVADVLGGRTRRDRVHRRRHRGRQPRDQGRGPRRTPRLDGLDGVVTTAFEHKGVLAAAHRLEAEGFRVEEAAVTPAGSSISTISPRALDDRTALVSVMGVNNELGTIQPLPRGRRASCASRATGAAPHRRGAGRAVGRRRDAARPGSTSSRSPATSSAGPRASACSWCGTGSCSTPRSRAAVRSAASAAGTVNVAGVVALATALRLTARPSGRGDRADRGGCATGCRPACSARFPTRS